MCSQRALHLTSRHIPHDYQQPSPGGVAAVVRKSLAGLDRLTHNAQMVVITGASFRAQGPPRWEKEVHIEPSIPS